MPAIAIDQRDHGQRACEKNKAALEPMVCQEAESQQGQYCQHERKRRAMNGAKE